MESKKKRLRSRYKDGIYWTISPPTTKQYHYAWNIAEKLNLMLPSELSFEEFSLFIEYHEQEFKEKKQKEGKSLQDILFEDQMKENQEFLETNETFDFL